MNKVILIDNLVKEAGENTSQFNVDVDGDSYQGYQIAKPLNYDLEYTSKKERKAMAQLVLDGKAIAVQYFADITAEQQADYVRNKLKEE